MTNSPESPTRLTEPSVSPHHATHDRKGREGRGEEWRDVVPLHLKSLTAAESTKLCRGCDQILPRSDFHRRGEGGVQHRCKQCKGANKNRATHVRHSRGSRIKAFGLTHDDFDALMEAQAGVCAICQLPETTKFRGTVRTLSIDHDHVTGEVRGLLCGRCNRGLGLFVDDPSRLIAAVAYLERSMRGRYAAESTS